jgi:hypothetical protein
VLAYADLADLLASAGAVVGGGASLGAVGGYAWAAVRRDIGRMTPWGRRRGWAATSVVKCVECGARYGGVFGVATVLAKVTDGG